MRYRPAPRGKKDKSCVPAGLSLREPGARPALVRLEELGTRRQLLPDHAGDADHSEPAVVELLGLHLPELGRAGRLEAERVEAEVARLRVGAQSPLLALERTLELEDGEDLGDGAH